MSDWTEEKEREKYTETFLSLRNPVLYFQPRSWRPEFGLISLNYLELSVLWAWNRDRGVKLKV